MRLLKTLENLLFATDPEQEDQPLNPPSGHSVLVIDDNTDLLVSLRQVLREAGFQVLTSSTGPKGLNMLQYAPSQISLVVLDFNMPNFDGLQALPYIHRLAPRVKILGMTGVEAKRLPRDFRDSVDKLIYKPFTSAELVNAAMGLLNSTAPAAGGRVLDDGDATTVDFDVSSQPA